MKSLPKQYLPSLSMTLKPPVKLFISGSAYFAESRLEKALSAHEDVESHSYYADDLDLSDFFNTLFTASLFNEYKLLVVKNIEAMKKPDDFFVHMEKGLDAVVIVVSTDEKKSAAAQKAAKKAGFEIEAEGRKSAASQKSDIKGIFEDHGIKIDDNTVSAIALLTEGDLIKVRSEAEKLALYFHGKDVSFEELLNNISGDYSASNFAFLDAFMERNKARCMEFFPLLSDKDIATSFSMIGTFMGALYFKLALPPLYNTGNPFLKGRDYFMRVVDKTGRKWKAADAAKMIDIMARLDLAVKTGGTDTPDALLMLIKEL